MPKPEARIPDGRKKAKNRRPKNGTAKLGLNSLYSGFGFRTSFGLLRTVLPTTLLSLTLAGVTLADTNSVLSSNATASLRAVASPQPTQALKAAQDAERTRTRCIEGRRYIAGRVLQVTPEGLIVDSGYSALLSPPFNHSWVVSGTASVKRDASAVEEKKPNAMCIGLVFLSNIPKRPAVKAYDYVVIHGYPAGEHVYSPVPGVQKMVRRFSASLERAVQINLDREAK
jgi:hypothetical protein